MSRKKSEVFRTPLLLGALTSAVLLAWTPVTDARVTKIVIDTRVTPAFNGATYGDAGQYETIAGRVYGELDPEDPHNTIIYDIQNAPKNAFGNVEYMATFFLVKPIDMARSSHLMWQDVPNRGGRLTLAADSRADGDIGLSSGWQGDNSGDTAYEPTPGNVNDWVVVPVAANPDGSPITGTVMGRIMNVGGINSQPIIEHSNPLPYKPITMDTTQATLESHDHETIDGIVTGVTRIPSTDWAWARCSATNPFPGTPDPTQLCVKGGFLPDKLYQVVFTAKDPYVLAMGSAAFRDAASFFKYETEDDYGNPNPVARGIDWIITRGSSQSGTFIRQLIHYGFTQDEMYRKVYDGAWPIIAARRIGLNFRFAKPDLVQKLYEAGAEGPLWWAKHEDKVRGLPKAGILDRCKQSDTCPKVIEHFGAAEVYGQKLTVGWVGTNHKKDIPLPTNVRRYYFAGSPHGGGGGGFNTAPGNAPNCSGTNYGPGTFGSNPMPQTQTVNALRFHFRNWVMNDTPPPPSVYPTIADGTLVKATKRSIGFPNIPQVLASAYPDAPNRFMMAFLDYDWGPGLDYSENRGYHGMEPPAIKQVIEQLVPKTDIDGNEVGGVPVTLMGAPLGTYLGWNVTASGFNRGKVCNYQGGWIPFAQTRAQRIAAGDPRMSLQERYGDHAGYVAAVTAAADNAMKQGYLLKADRDALIAQAAASSVLQ